MYLTSTMRTVIAAMSRSPAQERVICEIVFDDRPAAAVARDVGRSERTCRHWASQARRKLEELDKRDDIDLRGLMGAA